MYIDHPLSWKPIKKSQLESELLKILKQEQDHEEQQEQLRQFKLIHRLLAARAELYGNVSPIRIARFLSDLAEIVIATTVDMAFSELSHKHPEILVVKKQFAILAYGKLGSREMGYDSDVDLVFLHRAPYDLEPLITRLTQKILHMITTRTASGVLYPVDTRLRPSGSAGLLVSPVKTFTHYQLTHAWTWEHQALIKTRVIYGVEYFSRSLSELKKQIITKPRDNLRADVCEMREKMNKHLPQDEVKTPPGGLLDVEFFVQYLVLHAQDKNLARYTNTFSLLKQLFKMKHLSKEQFNALKRAYYSYHRALHRQSILGLNEIPSSQKLQLESIQKEIYDVVLYLFKE